RTCCRCRRTHPRSGRVGHAAPPRPRRRRPRRGPPAGPARGRRAAPSWLTSVWETPRVGANLADLVRAAAASRPEHPALVAAGRTHTWSQVDASVDTAAAGLQSLGLVTGDRVALVLGNVPEFVAAYFGALRAGLVAVPVNTA